MNILINLIPIKSGGGQQVISNFVIQTLKHKDVSFVYLVSENTYIHNMLVEQNNIRYYVVKNSLIGRFVFQAIKLKQIVKKEKTDIIYTVFGPGLHCNGVKSITGCAYSNLFFPEINFWQGYSPVKKTIDYYRLKSTLKSDGIIFENQAMMDRASLLFNYPENRMRLILPSVTQYENREIDNSFLSRMLQIKENDFNILILSGWHKNKNIEMIPFILDELKKRGRNNVKFIITVSKQHPKSIKLHESAKQYDVEKQIIFFDTILPHEVPVIFKKIDAVMLLSLLESFSNNIIESWFFKKPLFISDKEWSRKICKNAAIYIERENSKDIAEKVINYIEDIDIQRIILKNSDEILKEYPTPQEKIKLQIDFIKYIYEK
ncbi:MAG: glycosyltransferase [Dysgonamonadaceae bacterium]|jgi:hypothetical protein|nr:glycosyltransferase [Dysgonamonadaceae bacterium]